MAEVFTNSCKIFKNKTLPARQFHIWELGFASHILACEIKFPHSQKPNGNFTLLFLSGGSQHTYQITTSLWVHVHLNIFPTLSFICTFHFYYFSWTQLFSLKIISLFTVGWLVVKISGLKFYRWCWWQRTCRDISKQRNYIKNVSTPQAHILILDFSFL